MSDRHGPAAATGQGGTPRAPPPGHTTASEARGNRGEELLTARELLQLPGGDLVLRARAAAAGLLEALEAGTAAGGSLDGWCDLTRRGSLERLLPAEHLHEGDEFVRRHLDGEQLFLARQLTGAVPESTVLCWELTPRALGAPRRVALGAVLACLARARALGLPFRLAVNGRGTCPVATLEGLRALLEIAPAAEPPGPQAWREAIAGGGEPLEVLGLTSEPPLPGEPPGPPLPRPAGAFVALADELRLLTRRGERVACLQEAPGRKGAWTRRAAPPAP